MAIQKVVGKNMRSGLVGQPASYNGVTGGHYVKTLILSDPLASLSSIVGYACTFATAGNDEEVKLGGDGVFAGIVTDTGQFNIRYEEVVNSAQVELLQNGNYFGKSANATNNVGDVVCYSVADGSLTTAKDADAVPEGHVLIKNCHVYRDNGSSETPHLISFRINQ